MYRLFNVFKSGAGRKVEHIFRNNSKAISDELTNFETLKDFIIESRESLRNTIDSVKPQEKKCGRIFADSFSKLTSGVSQLNGQVGTQLEKNEIVSKMLDSIVTKLSGIQERVEWIECEHKAETFKMIWDEICEELHGSCVEMEDKSEIGKKEKDEINLIIKTIINKGSSAAKEIQSSLSLERTQKKKNSEEERFYNFIAGQVGSNIDRLISLNAVPSHNSIKILEPTDNITDMKSEKSDKDKQQNQSLKSESLMMSLRGTLFSYEQND